MGEGNKAVMPNFREVKLATGQVVKVAPLRLDSEEAILLMTYQGEAMDEGKHAKFLRHADKFIPALEKSIMENHTEEEAKRATSGFVASVNPYSDYIRCMYALAGLEPLTPPETKSES